MCRRGSRISQGGPRLERLEERALLATFQVVNTDNSGPGSLRQAILDANGAANMPGEVDRIEFDIPGSGVRTIRPTTSLPAITDPVVIDGYTQAGSTPNTRERGSGSDALLLVELEGNPLTDGLRITGGGSTIRGLVLNRFNGWGIQISGGGGNLVVGNRIGTSADGSEARGNTSSGIEVGSSNNTIGGTAPADRNVIAGNHQVQVNVVNVAGAPVSSLLIAGNFIGTDAAGAMGLGPLAGTSGVNLAAGTTGVTIGGTATGAGNVISGTAVGIANFGPGSSTSENLIQGNLIGTDATGTAPIGGLRGNVGISTSAGGMRIGGAQAGAGNVIGGLRRQGIVLASTGNVVRGNFIGTDRTVTHDLGNGDTGPSSAGVLVSRENNTIGGTARGEGNVIAHTRASALDDGNGVMVSGLAPGATRVTILGNSIYANAGLSGSTTTQGIRLAVSPLPPRPLLGAATASRIDGTLTGPPSTAFRLEFFATADRGPRSDVQGETYLGSFVVVTDGAGLASYSFGPAGGLPAGQFVTATATDEPTGSTSEFSAPVRSPQPEEPEPSLPAMSIDDVRVSESGTAVFTIRLSAPAGDGVAVDVQTRDVSAMAGADYTGLAVTRVRFATGETARDVTVAIRDDLTDEPDETFVLTLSSPSGAALADGEAIATIVDDDLAPLPEPNPEPEPAGDTSGPRVVDLRRYGFHSQPTLLVLRFSEPLNVETANDAGLYRLKAPGRDGRFGTRDDRAIAIRRAQYDAAAWTVTLTVVGRLPLQRLYRLNVNQGVRDAANNLLDGDADLRPGGAFEALIHRKLLAGPSGPGAGSRAIASTRFPGRGDGHRR